MLSVLIVGHDRQHLADDDIDDNLRTAIDAVIGHLSTVTAEKSASCRLLTGVNGKTAAAVAKIARQREVLLHLLANGLPKELDSNQTQAERTVWFGAPFLEEDREDVVSMRDEFALCLSNLLVVIWDGKDRAGEHSSNGKAAMRAAQMMKPTIWIGIDGAIRVLDRTHLNSETRQLLDSDYSEPTALCACFAPSDESQTWRRKVSDEIDLIFNPEIAATGDELQQLREYDSRRGLEKKPTRSGQMHESLMALASSDFKRLKKTLRARLLAPYWGPAGALEYSSIVSMPLLFRYFERSDVEANIAAGRHRDMTWLIYMASAFAVFSAVAGSISMWPGSHGPFWALAELALIASIVGGVALATRKRWHSRWIGHRFVAEQLRYARMCMPLLAIPRLFAEPAWKIANDISGRPRLSVSSAELWFVQRVIASEGLPAAHGQSMIASSRAQVEVVRTYVSAVIDDQRNYHKRNHHTYHKVQHCLHTLSMVLFAATALAVVGHFVVHANWLLMCTAFFPSLAAAIHGVTTKLEIVRIAGQSASTDELLHGMGEALRAENQANDWTGWLRLRLIAKRAAAAMSDENGQWQQLVQHQDAELPA